MLTPVPAEISALLRQGSAIGAFLLIVIMNGGRYLVIAFTMFAICRSHRGSPVFPESAKPSRAQVIHEIAFSAASISIFGCMNVVFMGYGLIAYSQLYWNVGTYGWFWFIVSIPLMLLIHDTWFYWLHRLLHTRILFRRVHAVHHRSVYPSAWAIYSFHPWEGLGEGLIAISVIFIIPVHPLAFVAYQTISTLLNAYGHCGKEFVSPNWQRHWLGSWINSSTVHSVHHAAGRGNYGLYFLLWDRLMSTHVEATTVTRTPPGVANV